VSEDGGGSLLTLRDDMPRRRRFAAWCIPPLCFKGEAARLMGDSMYQRERVRVCIIAGVAIVMLWWAGRAGGREKAEIGLEPGGRCGPNEHCK
jgi:hypothetical protein